ncbi:MAG: glucosamine-6-phosphate deaminase, partial [Bacteroidota bacterium]
MSLTNALEKTFHQLLESDPRQKERISTRVFHDSKQGSLHVARMIANFILANSGADRPTVLGLATGSSPIKIYEYLIKFYKEEGLSFKNVYTFNLDEYYPMQPEARQ